MKKLYLIILCIFIFNSNIIWTNNLLLFNTNNFNFPNLEVSVAYFTDNYEPLELKIANSVIRINSKESKIDSSILLNSSSKIPVNLTIVFELSSAINQEDIDFYKSLYTHFSNTSKSLFKELHFVFIAEKPIYLSENKENTAIFDSLKFIKFFRKADFNNLLNSQVFQNLQTTNNALLLVSKSQLKLNIDQFVNYINSSQTKFLHISLTDYKYQLYDEICRKTNSISINKNDFEEPEKLVKLTSYILTSGPYFRLYTSESLKKGDNIIELKNDLDEGSYWLKLYDKDFPAIDIAEPVYFYGVLDSGIKRTKIFKVIGKNRTQVITDITSSNSNFKILNFQPNSKLLPNEEFDLKIEFQSQSTVFDSSVITLYTNANQEYRLYLYAGQAKSFTKDDLQFIGVEKNMMVLGNDLLRFQWTGSHPLDTFLVQYKIFGEDNWRLISPKSSGNMQNWVVPDIPDTSIQLRLSQLNNKLISEKVILLKEHRGKISELSFSPNDSLIATAGEDGYIYLWNSKNGKKVKTLFQSQSKIISSIDWSKDGKYLAIAALDTSIKIWSMESDVLFRDIITNNKVLSVQFSFDGNYLIARQNDNILSVYEFPSLQIVNTYQIPFDVTYFELNPNNHYFLATSLDGNFIVFDYLQIKNIANYPTTGFPILSGSFSPSGNNVVITGVDNKIRIYDVHTGQNVLTIFDSQSPVIEVNWLKNRQFIASSSGEFVKLWSPSDGKLLETYDQHSSGVYYIKSNNKGNLVASVDQNNIIHLWSPFDFPFTKPMTISIESPQIHVIQKKVKTNSYFISNIQVTDTFNFYFEDVAFNDTKKYIYIDTLTLSSSSNIINIDEKYSFYPFNSAGTLPVTMNYIPRNIGLNQIDFNIKSGTKTFKSQVNANVLPNILDRKFLEINLGNVPLRTSKDTSVFMLQNISDTPIIIDSIKFYNGVDFELVSLQLPFEIRPIGGVFAPTIRFSPKQIGFQSGFFRIFLDRLLPIDVYFYGEGLAPKLDFVNELKTITNVCEKSITIPIIIRNSGNSVLDINTIQIDALIKNEFSILNYPLKIEPTSIDTIWLKWTPIIHGNNIINITIKTNLQATNREQSNIEFQTEYNYYSFNINPSPVIYEPLDDNNRIQKLITIKNIGSIFSDFNIENKLKYFTLDSIQKVNNTGLLYISFLGGLQKDYYSDTLIIKDDCGVIYSVELIALLNKNQALLTIQDSIDLGVLICENKVEKQILIQNVGNSDLIISEISFQNPLTSLNVTPNELTIPPNSFSYITIIYQPNKSQFIKNTLTLKTNAINHSGGLASIPIVGIKEEVSYSFDSDTIDFGYIAQDVIIEKEALFENIGTIALSNSFKNFDNTFTLLYTEEANIFPNQKKKITIRKNATTKEGLILDSLVYTDLCGTSKKVILKINIGKTPKQLIFSLPYPNPTFNESNISIKSNSTYNLSYQLVDYLGKIAKQTDVETITDNYYNLNINLNNYSAGIYLLKVKIDNNEYEFKLIKLN